MRGGSIDCDGSETGETRGEYAIRSRGSEDGRAIMARSDRPLDNPINWSFKAGRLFEIDIRVHVAFIICAVILIWMEMPKADDPVQRPFGGVLVDALGFYALLFLVVLLHEFGHCFGARHTGGEGHRRLRQPFRPSHGR